MDGSTKTRIYIGNISFRANEELFKETLSVVEGIREVVWCVHPITKEFKGFAFVDFESEEMAERALEILDGFDYLGRAFACSWSEKEKE